MKMTVYDMLLVYFCILCLKGGYHPDTGEKDQVFSETFYITDAIDFTRDNFVNTRK